MGLGPFQLAGLSLHLEVLMTLRAAEAECTGVIAHKCYAFARIAWLGAEMAGLDSVI